ncbi:hypothetical protein Tola_2112 [Tolumonas auensis DSM 9187]|uniref:Uncharacterized protein n=1 Tax=Tolumonas auensis (strain DSM 9187 / NBRC 110442 / TA 4) TaxID=595494 RepID=C4L865_TOLAT|nr:hypothetical protein Tola_2112 [Tolumonas auensis DSM 9187]
MCVWYLRLIDEIGELSVRAALYHKGACGATLNR